MTVHDEVWLIRASEPVLHTPFLKIRKESVVLPDGSEIPDYYILESHGFVGVVPVTEDGRFVINYQYKHGIRQVVLEFAAGSIDTAEELPLLAAQRELMEETGYSTEEENYTLLSEMIANPTQSASRGWWYLARNVRMTGIPKVDPAEVIETDLVTARELMDLIKTGKFAIQGHIAAAYLALEALGYLSFQATPQ